ncbi:TPA: hypothetical protein JLK23_004038 [Escherichia coli]|nr:hypothetical protein [Escherichia coli]
MFVTCPSLSGFNAVQNRHGGIFRTVWGEVPVWSRGFVVTLILLEKLNVDKYEAVYGGYKGKEAQNIFFVPFMTDENGENTPTNAPAEDPDIPVAGYYGAASRTQNNWTVVNRDSHFNSWSRRGIVSDRLAAAILVHCGRGAEFIGGVIPDSPSGDTSQPEQLGGNPPADNVFMAVSYLAYEGIPRPYTGWTVSGGTAAVVEDGTASGGKALTFSKQKDSAWRMKHTTQAATESLSRGGQVTCIFKILGNLVDNQYAFGLYWKIPASVLPQGVAFADSDIENSAPFLLSFLIQSDGANLNLIHHRQQNTKLESFGAFNNEWDTLTFEFAGNNSTHVVPVLDDVRGTPFELANGTAPLDENEFELNSITSNPTYDTEFELLSLEISPSEKTGITG